MGLINQTNIPTSIGEDMINTFCNVVFNTSQMLVTGQVFCSLNWYKSEADFDAGADKVYPMVDGKRIEDTILQLTMEDIVKVGDNCTMQDVVNYFFQETADKLSEDYSWVVVIS